MGNCNFIFKIVTFNKCFLFILQWFIYINYSIVIDAISHIILFTAGKRNYKIPDRKCIYYEQKFLISLKQVYEVL